MPKTKEQYEQIKLERKNAILKGALYLFAINGYNSTTSDDISKFVGCSHGLLYHYFLTKDDLFNELFEEIIKTTNREIISNINFEEKPSYLIKDILDAYLSAIKNEDDRYACVIYLLLNLHLQRKYLPKQKNSDPAKRIPDILINTIEKGKQSGEFEVDNTKEVVIAILSMLKGLSFTRIHLGSKDFRCPSSEIISRMVMNRRSV